MNRPRSLTDREKRTVRYAGIGIAVYLLRFCGLQVWKSLEAQRADYRRLVAEARQLRERAVRYQDKVQVVKKMMDDFHLDPARIKKETAVADASAAIQFAAKSGGLQLGTVRESPARGTGKTLATVQLDTSGPVPAVLNFLAGLNTIGFPVVVDSVQFTADNMRPGQLKVNLTILILDFDSQTEAPHA